MGVKLSKLYGMEMFTDGGKFIGTAQEFVINTEAGEVSRILLEQLPASKEKTKQILKEKSLMYKNVKSVEDVIVIKKRE
ncbi:PRC-barrel domain-containing protein [Candidatus Micrarchaeota archaeon]|nr:PRC-barrel domain-containing protein [Candidatus Micrarchaeota archaeon]